MSSTREKKTSQKQTEQSIASHLATSETDRVGLEIRSKQSNRE
jgi:hypothetical protein